jgi:Piwi domain
MWEQKTQLQQLGLGVPNKEPPVLQGNPNGDMRQILSDAMGRAANVYGQKPDLVFIFQRASSDVQYKAIKFVGEILLGIPTQVMATEKAKLHQGSGFAQYCANIALKVNAKLGGINSEIRHPLLSSRRWMMLGADVSHPDPAALRRNPPPPSYAGTYVSNFIIVSPSNISSVVCFLRYQLLCLYSCYNGSTYDAPASCRYIRDVQGAADALCGEEWRQIPRKYNILA